MKNKFILLAALTLSCFSLPAFADNSCPLRREIGQLIIAEYSGEMASFKDYVKEANLGGVILLGYHTSSFQSPNDVIHFTNEIQKDMPTGLFVAVDQEGGLVQRLGQKAGFTWAPAAKYVGEAYEKDKTLPRKLGKMMGEELAAVGVNLNLAPMADLAIDPASNVVAGLKRGFSDDAKVTGAVAGEMIEGLQSTGVMATVKHFPGHGRAKGDSHAGVVTLDLPVEELVKHELVPFVEAMNRGVAALMTAHIDMQGCDGPVSLNKEVLTGLIREGLGYQGILMTDDLSMGAITSRYGMEEAAIQAVLAGNDTLIVRGGSDKQMIERFCQESEKDDAQGRELSRRIHESFLRIQRIKKEYGIDHAAQLPDVELISTEEHKEVVKAILENSPSGIGAKDKYLPPDMSQGLKDL
ncbi:MAG TPA: glycoside hydrolase family 3 N-terminal domain-containing protein, partial [Bdellovibrionota bacterium]